MNTQIPVRLKKWWKRNRPSLEFYFSLWPIIRIQTALLHERHETLWFEICRVEVWLFKNRVLSFNLYKDKRN